jgi:alkylation response protein AidB-like acyl-CoA dehydrogenase
MYILFLKVDRYQMKCKVPDEKIGALIALAKVQGGKLAEFCAREASQILGGNSCIRGGKGERIERIYPLLLM